MGSKQKRLYYDKLNQAFSTKYSVDVRDIKSLRGLFIQQGKSKDEIILYFKDKLKNGNETIKLIAGRCNGYNLILNFLTTCTQEVFKDITNKNLSQK